MRISIIIPALNEEKCIEETLENLVSNHNPAEIIVVDAGSTDSTAQKASRFAKVIQSERGRAQQMNQGAREATGDVFLFLHADTFLPENALNLIEETLNQKDCDAGRFFMQFDENKFSLNLFSSYTRFRCFSYGDQALFIRKSLFESLEGFRGDVPFEDVDFFKRLSKVQKFALIKNPVTTSARRFTSQGSWTQKWINLFLVSFYYLGLDISSLKARFYPDVR